MAQAHDHHQYTGNILLIAYHVIVVEFSFDASVGLEVRLDFYLCVVSDSLLIWKRILCLVFHVIKRVSAYWLILG